MITIYNPENDTLTLFIPSKSSLLLINDKHSDVQKTTNQNNTKPSQITSIPIGYMSILKANNIVYCISQSIQKQKKHMQYTSKCMATKRFGFVLYQCLLKLLIKTEKKYRDSNIQENSIQNGYFFFIHIYKTILNIPLKYICDLSKYLNTKIQQAKSTII